MKIEIKKAKIKSKIFLSTEYTETVGTIKKKRSEDADAPIHEDLQAAFNKLIPHFALICQQTNRDEVEDMITDPENYLPTVDEIPEGSILKRYKVTGYTVGGSGDSAGVTLSGHKTLNTGKTISFNTPFIKWDELGDDGYEYTGELQIAIDELNEEVLEYLDGKCAKVNQTEMNFEEEAFEPIEEGAEEEEFTPNEDAA